MRRSTLAVLALALSGTAAVAAGAGGVTVPIDEARTITYVKPVTTVFVGNPAIADINMVDSHHAFVLGKAYGTTNVIALDNTGHEVSNVYVSVSENRGAHVTLFRSSAQLTMACGGARCQVAPTPGDAHYKDDITDVVSHHDLGTKSASAAAGSSQ